MRRLASPSFPIHVEHLLGWKLDHTKTEIGTTITLLGLEVSMGEQASEWRPSRDKALEWAEDIQRHLDNDRLLPAEASKLCGRLAFLSSKVYGRLARALIRPIIWRQVQPFWPD